ncbi:hypothetical protein OC842_007310 [Tilletia horrida]|uniref:Retrotransposon gag domain-containing protein n=1 Tax=Tilletia horrida TaxID=155126 RepID=A0AAN6JMK5_9BASI|nr:hypothetical protein OC842_007310 [Tilletia horrida]
MPPRRQPAPPVAVPSSVPASPGPPEPVSPEPLPPPTIPPLDRSAQAASAPTTPRGTGSGLPSDSAVVQGPQTPRRLHGPHAQSYEPLAPLFGPHPRQYGSHTHLHGPPAHDTGSSAPRYDSFAPFATSAPHGYLGIGTADIANLVVGRLDGFSQQMERLSRVMDGMHARIYDLEYSHFTAARPAPRPDASPPSDAHTTAPQARSDPPPTSPRTLSVEVASQRQRVGRTDGRDDAAARESEPRTSVATNSASGPAMDDSQTQTTLSAPRPHGPSSFRSTAIPPHLTGDDSDPVARYHRLPKAEQDALAKILKRFDLNVTQFLDERSKKSAGSSDDMRMLDPPSSIRAAAAQGSAVSSAVALGAAAPAPSAFVPTAADPRDGQRSGDGRGGQPRPPPPPPPHAPPATSTPLLPPMQCKPEWMPTFHGEPHLLEEWITDVRGVARSRADATWKASVLSCIPLLLKDGARVWANSLRDAEVEELTTLTAWFDELRAAFPVNAYEQRRQARQREWAPAEESAAVYYMLKLRTLRAAYGDAYDESNLVHDILDGIPPTFRYMLQVPRDKPTLRDVLRELTQWEPMWRQLHKQGLRSGTAGAGISPTRAVSSLAKSSSMVRTTSAPAIAAAPSMSHSSFTPSAPATSRQANSSIASAGGHNARLSSTYDPSRITPAADGRPRTYKRPDNDRVMTLNRSCSRCNGEHFDFEHEHVHAAAQVRTMEPEPYPEHEEGELTAAAEEDDPAAGGGDEDF